MKLRSCALLLCMLIAELNGCTTAAVSDGVFGTIQIDRNKVTIFARKKQVIDYLKNLSLKTNRILIGQNLGSLDDTASDEAVSKLVRITGKYPALLGLDMGYGNTKRVLTNILRYVREFSECGGLVTLCMHPDNPETAGSAWDTNFTAQDQILTPGNRIYSRWTNSLRFYGDVMSALQQAGVTVILRPFQEMNTLTYWWSCWTDVSQFLKLWNQTYLYFTEIRELTNMVWAFSPGYNGASRSNTIIDYYPGSNTVDVLAPTYYSDTFTNLSNQTEYQQLSEFSAPIAYLETGPAMLLDGSFNALQYLELRKHYPALCGILARHSQGTKTYALCDNSNITALMNSPQAITLDRMYVQ